MANLTLTNPKFYFLKLKELIKFFKYPDINISNNQRIKANIKDMLALLILKVFISLLLAALLMQLFDAEKIVMNKLHNEFSPGIILLLGGLLAPLIEETAFRLSLKFKPIYLSISATLLFFYIISKFYFKTGYINLDNQFLLRIALSIIVGVMIYLVSKRFAKKLNAFWELNFKWIYYVSIILFGFVHITNFEMNTKNLMLIPILTLPQSVGGIFMGYIRIKYGFVFVCLFHVINNLFALSFSIEF